MEAFAKVQDIIDLKRELSDSETSRAEKLLTIVSNSLRQEAFKVGKDLDAMIEESEYLGSVAKAITVDVVTRELNSSTTAEPMSQVSQSGLGYSVSGTYLVPGGGIYFKKSELARLGLKRQRIGAIEIYGYDQGNNCNFSSDD